MSTHGFWWRLCQAALGSSRSWLMGDKGWDFFTWWTQENSTTAPIFWRFVAINLEYQRSINLFPDNTYFMSLKNTEVIYNHTLVSLVVLPLVLFVIINHIFGWWFDIAARWSRLSHFSGALPEASSRNWFVAHPCCTKSSSVEAS